MNHDWLNLVDVSSIHLADDKSWIHALPVGEYNHPVYGKMSLTSEKITNFAENIKAKVRGIDPSINEMHGVSGDGPAAGWVKDADARPDGLWLSVEWTPATAQAIKDKKWRYFSAEYRDKWTNPQGKEFKNVIFGGALTNRPFMKNLLPINLSESSVENALELVKVINASKAAHVDLVETSKAKE